MVQQGSCSLGLIRKPLEGSEMRRKSAVGAMKGHSAKDLTQFLDIVRKIRVKWSSGTFITVKAGARVLWFRGQQNAAWGLQPKLLRPEFRVAAQPESEAEIRQEFQSRALQMVQGRLPAGKWEWYFLMQHYGAPTRLLDWTGAWWRWPVLRNGRAVTIRLSYW